MTQSEKIAKFLKENISKRFTAREIAQGLINSYPEEYERKKKNSHYTDIQLLNQVASEIGSHKKDLLKSSISWDDFNKPRRYFFSGGETKGEIATKTEDADHPFGYFKEIDLYPLLINFLNNELGLECIRINESTSKNKMGAGANKWLHPDIVAMQKLDNDFTKDVRELIQLTGSSYVRLWSFEVKREIRVSNLRESFFQAVSNSSWANEGYLVAANFAADVEQDLRILSSLHGIGIIRLELEDPLNSEILLPSARRENVDWQSLNRISKVNKDFTNFVKKVLDYIKKGEIINLPAWNQ